MAVNPEPNPPGNPPNFEDALSRLEAVVHELEEGQLGLNDALARYEEGVRLLRQCHGILQGAQQRIELLAGIDAAGEPITEPFAAEASLSLEEKANQRSRRRTAGPCTPESAAEPGTAGGGVDTPGGVQ